MPSKPRQAIIDPDVAGLYHCYCRCVRRAFLCGYDRFSRKDYSHRRDWIEARLRQLAAVFAVDIHFFCIMQNHLHVLLGNLPELAKQWSDQEVIRRACLAFPVKFQKLGVVPGKLTEEQVAAFAADAELVAQMRSRLCDISWFMRQLTHGVAVRSNREDDQSGHFWESRFKSLPINDLFGLLMVAMYIDMNEVAAGAAASIETSRYTSAYHRLQGASARRQGSPNPQQHDGFLPPISCLGDNRGYPPGGQLGSPRASDRGVLETTWESYLEELQALCRRRHGCSPESARDASPAEQLASSPALAGAGLTAETMLDHLRQYGQRLFRRPTETPSPAARAAEQAQAN